MESGAPGPPAVDDPSRKLSESARGWHTIQLAVLGFIGICGVLRTSSPTTPDLVQLLAAILAVAALVLACWAVFVVGRVAWPTTAVPPSVAGARLRAGIRITVLALVLVVVSALSGWWPKPAADTADTVSVTDSAGQTWCGPLTSAPSGTVGVHTAQQVVNVPLQTVAQIRAVSGCP
jgi:hypothetical protein